MKKKSWNITVSKWLGLCDSITFFVFSLLCCKYIRNIYLSMLDFNGLCKFNNIFIYKITKDIQQCEPKEEWPHAGLYNYNGMFSILLISREFE